MALQDRLMNNLRAELTGAVDPQIEQQLWNTIDEFCRETHAWRETIAITLVEGDSTYPVAPAGTEVVHIFSVSHETMDASNIVYEFGNITLADPPTAAEAASPLYVIAALTPAHSNTDIENLIPADMWSENMEAFKDGVMSKLMGQPAKPYSNPNMAGVYFRKFRSAKAQARVKARTGGVIGGQVWRYPRHTR